MTKQVKSKQRVADHGEVFTAEREVNAMLDLVKNETERIDSRFLEPACGDGNFLSAILKRKLAAVKTKYKSNQSDYEKYSLLSLMSIYGVDILTDNATQCRERLYDIWQGDFTANFKTLPSEDSQKTARFILEKNIVCGNALTMKCVDTLQQDLSDSPIVFPEWSFVSGELVKRRDFRFDVLLQEHKQEIQLSLFDMDETDSKLWGKDPITNERIPLPIKEFTPINFRSLWQDEK